MTDALFPAVQLSSPAHAGYRLHQLEVFNWGTFDQRVWRLTAGGDTSLLTGDIGSGKSTLVDAVTTLLLPAHRISYNKAAGAESKERSLRSYVEGHYKSERVESTGMSRAIGLRNSRSYSVILGVFVNDGYDETVSLAQVFHQRDRSGQPDRFFVTSDKPLSIEADFTDFGSDLNELRRRLRATGATISQGFPEYSRHLRRLLGIRSDQALELFHQTVSMKSVGNLNEFVRSHMLEPVDASDRIAAIVGQQTEFAAVAEELRELDTERQRVDARAAVLARLEEYAAWRDLDWETAQAQADSAQQERARLLAGSSRLDEIERQLVDNEQRGIQLDERLEQLRAQISVLGDRIDRARKTRQQETSYVDGQPAHVLTRARSHYDAVTERLGRGRPQEADACQQAASDLTADLQQRIDRIGRELGGHATSLLGAMNDVRRRWPEATTEMDAILDARGEFRAFRDRVAEDDLPAFEVEFKRQLNTNTIRELAGFSSWLRRQADEIHARVDRINEALGAIDYSPGRYITLVAERTVNQEVQAFRSELRAATDDTLGPDDDRYSEQRFLDVQRILERFRGREGYAEADKAWTRRVSDVRNWFTFSASERVKETGEEWEHYRDSDGKSGGQKEKLAYTILAASLAYQFGLEWGVERSRDFRFAVIDEAFGRGSDISTRYALDLFGKLGLQLLIVTPLQKVHVIEPYVRAIGFVDNPTGSCSRLQTLTIEEFRARRESSSHGT